MKRQATAIMILMADDDADDRLMTQEALEESRLINGLHFVEDGEDLMDYLHRRGRYADLGNTPLPGLILLDLNMPRMNGIEFLRELRSDEKLRHTPVVVLTTSDDERDKINAYNLNVAGYLLKPVTFVNFVEVMATLNKYWTLVELP